MSELIRDYYRPGSGRAMDPLGRVGGGPGTGALRCVAAGPGRRPPLGFSAERLRGVGVPGWASPYAAGLSVVSVALACLAPGLIRPWGEVFPQWVPVLGGRNVPALAAVIAAGLAAVLLTVICVAGAAGWSNQFDVTGSPSGEGRQC